MICSGDGFSVLFSPCFWELGLGSVLAVGLLPLGFWVYPIRGFTDGVSSFLFLYFSFSINHSVVYLGVFGLLEPGDCSVVLFRSISFVTCIVSYIGKI